METKFQENVLFDDMKIYQNKRIMQKSNYDCNDDDCTYDDCKDCYDDCNTDCDCSDPCPDCPDDCGFDDCGNSL